MRDFIRAASLVLAMSLTACASGSISLDPTTAHIAAGLIVKGEPILCAQLGKSDLCSKKTAKAVGSVIEDAAQPPK